MGTLLLALALAAAPAAPLTSTFGVKAGLDARQQVPRQAVARPNATGVLSGTLAITGAHGTLTWKLTYAGLSGKARGAELHRGAPGRRGPLVAALCAPCRPGAHGTTPLTAERVKAARNSGLYVVVTTRKNPAGEIRGQLRILSGA